MDLIPAALQAAGLFLATNIDDIIVLSLFFARSAGVRGTTTRIGAGQYLGFGGIIVASILVALGAGTFLPAEVIPYFGLVPLALGLYAAWKAWRDREEDEEQEDENSTGEKVGVWTVAAVTFANGGDNIGVYVPVFVTVGPAAVVAYSVVFLLLVAVLVAAAKYVATRRPIAKLLERWESVLFPIVLIALGAIILIEGGAFGL